MRDRRVGEGFEDGRWCREGAPEGGKGEKGGCCRAEGCIPGIEKKRRDAWLTLAFVLGCLIGRRIGVIANRLALCGVVVVYV